MHFFVKYGTHSSGLRPRPFDFGLWALLLGPLMSGRKGVLHKL